MVLTQGAQEKNKFDAVEIQQSTAAPGALC